MLEADVDDPIIRRAIERRLGKEPGVYILAIHVDTKPATLTSPGFIAVGINARIDEMLDFVAFFDLPLQFQHVHLINEIDQCCEKAKEARRDFGRTIHGGLLTEIMKRKPLGGTGRRGLWRQFA